MISNNLDHNRHYQFTNKAIFGINLRYCLNFGAFIMAKQCQITGMKPLSGCNVSHAHNRTKRRFYPNIQKKRIWVASENRYITLRISARGLRTLDKLGIDAVLEKINDNEDIN